MTAFFSKEGSTGRASAQGAIWPSATHTFQHRRVEEMMRLAARRLQRYRDAIDVESA